MKELRFRSLKELPDLEGWLTFGEAAADLELSGERIRQMAQEGKLTTAHRIGRRPVGVVREEEIAALVEAKRRALAPVDEFLDHPVTGARRARPAR